MGDETWTVRWVLLKWQKIHGENSTRLWRSFPGPTCTLLWYVLVLCLLKSPLFSHVVFKEVDKSPNNIPLFWLVKEDLNFLKFLSNLVKTHRDLNSWHYLLLLSKTQWYSTLNIINLTSFFSDLTEYCITLRVVVFISSLPLVNKLYQRENVWLCYLPPKTLYSYL